MTRPDQPREYGAPAPAVSPTTLRREYRAPNRAPLSGQVTVRAADDSSVTAEVVNGVLEVTLVGGTYRIIGVLRDPSGGHHYVRDEAQVARYR